MTRRFWTLSVLATGALMAAVQTARAQAANCAPHEQVVSQLAERYGETRRSIGLAHNNALVELFASAQTGTWTITVTGPGGTTCLVASGEAFETLADRAESPGEGA